MKVSLNLINFLEDEYENEDDVKLHEIAETKAREIIEKHAGSPKITHLSVLAKKKELSADKSADNKSCKVQTSALFEF